MIELYHGGPIGHSASVLIALAEKGLAYRSHPLDLAGYEQHGDAFLAVNPAGQVPVLRDDGRTLTETFFILLYLDETYPDPPLQDADPRARYAVQKWGKYVETHIAPNLAIVGWSANGVAPGAAAQSGIGRLTPERRALWDKASTGFGADEVAAARAALGKAAGRVAEDLGAGPWLAGARYGLADIAVFPHLARYARLAIDLPASVAEWLARVAERPAVADVMNDAEIDAAFATMGPEPGRWG